ncbi:MAG: hypothetical protein JXB19_08720 [Bacteroidales bacterium]|nr:hypothetical protein [Bacteroidales bacterium]
MKHLVTITIIMIVMVCCNTRHSQRTSANPDDTITFRARLIDTTNDVPYYESDDFYAFRIEPDTKNIVSLYKVPFKLSKEPFVNIHDTTVVDTIYTYAYRDNKIVIYKSRYKDLLAQFDVTDSMFEINGKLSPGISKDYFLNKFNIDHLIHDTVDIGNMDRTDVNRFYFRNNTLVRIRIEPYLD